MGRVNCVPGWNTDGPGDPTDGESIPARKNRNVRLSQNGGEFVGAFDYGGDNDDAPTPVEDERELQRVEAALKEHDADTTVGSPGPSRRNACSG